MASVETAYAVGVRAGTAVAVVEAAADKPVAGTLAAVVAVVAAVVAPVCNSRSAVSAADSVTVPYCNYRCLPHCYYCSGNNYYRCVLLYMCS